MAKKAYRYAIVGGGLAGASAIQGIRERDRNGPILMIGSEKHLPYDRPPLTKKLWLGKKTVEEIFLRDRKFYDDNGVAMALGSRAVSLDPRQKTVSDDNGNVYGYEKLLLATGGTPRTLAIPGGTLDGICYFRFLDDYLRMRREAAEGKSAVVIGGGFIGSEIAAALAINKVNVTMVFPSPNLCSRVFPEPLGRALRGRYEERGVKVLAGEKPAAFTRDGDRFVTHTQTGKSIESDMIVVGIGIEPAARLARDAGLDVEDGIVLNELLQTSHPDIYAAGDNARFPCEALGERVRVEHWDNALNQGKWAGRNMAGAREPYTYLPYFFSDLFEFGYEAVGDVNAQLETFCDWQKDNDTGVVYCLKQGKVRGVMLCNVWEKLDAAREMIRKGEQVNPSSLRGAIR